MSDQIHSEQSNGPDYGLNALATQMARERDLRHRQLLVSEREANIYRKALRDIVEAKPRWWRVWSVAREALRAGLECRS